jgi:hypothetical protein
LRVRVPSAAQNKKQDSSGSLVFYFARRREAKLREGLEDLGDVFDRPLGSEENHQGVQPL